MLGKGMQHHERARRQRLRPLSAYGRDRKQKPLTARGAPTGNWAGATARDNTGVLLGKAAATGDDVDESSAPVMRTKAFISW